MKTQYMNVEVRGLKTRVKELAEALFFINSNHGKGAIADVRINTMTPTRMTGHVIRHIPITQTRYHSEKLAFRVANGKVHYIGKSRVMGGPRYWN